MKATCIVILLLVGLTFTLLINGQLQSETLSDKALSGLYGGFCDTDCIDGGSDCPEIDAIGATPHDPCPEGAKCLTCADLRTGEVVGPWHNQILPGHDATALPNGTCTTGGIEGLCLSVCVWPGSPDPSLDCAGTFSRCAD